MREIIVFFALVALLTIAIKAALVLLILAGLIFRTKETVGLLLIFAIIGGFAAHPLIGCGLLVGSVAISLFFKHKEQAEWSDEQE